MPDKAALRRAFAAARRQRPALQRQVLDEAIARRILASPLYENAPVLLGYLAYREEISVDAVLVQALRQGKRVYVPRCLDGEGRMAFFALTSFAELEIGMYGIREPARWAPSYEETPGALCLVPGFAFDEAGYRLGYGKGYYDRFLSKSRAISLGICYNQTKVCQLPRGEYDRPVHFLCTEQELVCLNGPTPF